MNFIMHLVLQRIYNLLSSKQTDAAHVKISRWVFIYVQLLSVCILPLVTGHPITPTEQQMVAL